MRTLTLLVLLSFATVAAAAPATPLLSPRPFVPLTFAEEGKGFRGNNERVEVLADRMVYHADELNGQFYVLFLGKLKPEEAAQRRIRLELRSMADKKLLAAQMVTPVTTPKLPVLVHTAALAPGKYELTAKLLDLQGKLLEQAARTFERSDHRDAAPAFPAAGIPIHVHAQEHVPGAAWPISTGVPMPKATLRDVSELALLENGKPVPAQFITRGTWGPEGYVKWVGVDFIARYDGGKPREYRLVRAAEGPARPAKAVTIRSTSDRLVVENGVLRLELSRKAFAGIEKAWLDRNGDGAFAAEECIIDGPGGPFVVDNNGVRYESRHDAEVQVEVEEAGPLQATIAAKGWHVSEAGERLCKFTVRLRIVAGQPHVALSHRVINTIADQYEDTRLADVGFHVAPAAAPTQWRFGVDGAAVAEQAAGAGSVFLHQDRSDRLRLVSGDQVLREGKRADGWMSLTTPRGTVTTILRDIWQKFPKELEAELGARPKIGIHLWPRHGHIAFDPVEEVDRQQIYKVRWAHQGPALELLIPDHYHEKLREFHESEGWAGGAELAIVDSRRKLTKMQASSGQGTAMTGEIVLLLHEEATTIEQVAAFARLVQQSPHALSDPAWNCATNAFGPIAPRDPGRYGPAEKLMDSAYSFYRRAIIDAGDEYGMWIYGGVHSAWNAQLDAAVLTRVWQQSHYQNVFQAWMLYYRSGLPEHHQWAWIHSSQHLDVGVNNYRRYPEGKHSYARLGELGGDIYHCKGFMPWAGNSSSFGHWIDIANYFARYYLTGDRHGLDSAQTWRSTINKLNASGRLEVPATREGFQNPEKMVEIAAYLKENPGTRPDDLPQWMRDERAKPAQFNPREVFVPLGELVQYYEGTWDPQAMIQLQNYAEYLNTPFEFTNSPALAAFGKHWQHWYWELTRDPRVVERVREYMEQQSQLSDKPRIYTFAAFLYHATGEDRYVKPVVWTAYDATLNIYEQPGDRYDGYSLGHNNPSAKLLGQLPFFMHAATAAGLPFDRSGANVAYLPTRGGRADRADKYPVPPRGWTNTGVTVLAYAPQPTRLAVAIDPARGYASPRGFYQVFANWPRLNMFSLPDGAERAKAMHEQMVTFPGTNAFNDPSTQRNYGVGRPPAVQPFPYVELADNDPEARFYRLEHGGSYIALPVFQDASTGQPLPQVAVISRTQYANAQVREASFTCIAASELLFRPLDPKAVIHLRVESVPGRYSMPTTVRIVDAAGREVLNTSVFSKGSRQEAAASLDPADHPLPWRLLTASSGDNRITFSGADELFFARSEEDFQQVLPKLEVVQP